MISKDIKYSMEIGRKFNKDGTPRIIPGNTFISMVDHDSEIFNHLLKIINILKETNFYKKYIQLPHDSYHMTVIEGVIPEFSEDVWTTHLTKDCKLEEVDQYFREKVDKIEPMKRVEMKCECIHMSKNGCSIRLLPNSKEDQAILEKYRDDVADQCGLRFPNHHDYHFHISLAYLWKELNEEELSEREIAIKKINDYLIQEVKPFIMPPAKLVFFNTMFKFDDVRD